MRFLLVDRIVELERGKRARAIKNVAMTEDFLEHHFPGTPIMPGALIAEAAVQLASWLVRDATDFERSGLPVEVERVRFQELVRPGDQLEFDLTAKELTDEQGRFSVEVTCRQRRVATGRFTMKLVPTEELEDVADARRLFEVLRQPLSSQGPA